MDKKTKGYSMAIDINDAVKVRLERQDGKIKKEGGCVKYISGWSDAAIARQLGCSKSQVENIRKERFGNLIPSKSSGYEILEERIRALEQSRDSMRENVRSLQRRLDGLMKQLGEESDERGQDHDQRQGAE